MEAILSSSLYSYRQVLPSVYSSGLLRIQWIFNKTFLKLFYCHTQLYSRLIPVSVFKDLSWVLREPYVQLRIEVIFMQRKQPAPSIISQGLQCIYLSITGYLTIYFTYQYWRNFIFKIIWASISCFLKKMVI